MEKHYIKMNERMAFNTEVSNNEVGFNSSKNVDEFINVIKLVNSKKKTVVIKKELLHLIIK